MLTPEEVGYLVQDCGARVVIGTHEKLEPLLPLKDNGCVSTLISFAKEGPEGMLILNELLHSSVAGYPHVSTDPDSTSTICYTSGTMGHPKGAMHSHHNVLMNAQLTALMHGRQERDTVVTALPLPHVYGTVVMNSTFITGGTLVLHSKFDESAILNSIQLHKATLFEGVPTMYFFLLNFSDLDDHDLSSLRACTVGGQAMPETKMKEVEQHLGCPLIELWGMTELAGLGTTFAHTGPFKHGSIGVPLLYCQARVVDMNEPARVLSAYEVGELMLKGPIVMQGYYGNETATRETIEPDGWLHTGDLARVDEDGYIYIVDRKKDMIITSGYNVYPAEIERVIAGHPDVTMVAVGSIPDEAKGELAKAYIIPKSGTLPEEGSIIMYCRKHLAAYKVPRDVQFVDDLPKTSSGKIMRRRLKELDQGRTI